MSYKEVLSMNTNTISTEVSEEDLPEGLSPETKLSIMKARIAAQNVQAKIEPEHILGYQDLLAKLHHAIESIEAEIQLDKDLKRVLKKDPGLLYRLKCLIKSFFPIKSKS